MAMLVSGFLFTLMHFPYRMIVNGIGFAYKIVAKGVM